MYTKRIEAIKNGNNQDQIHLHPKNAKICSLHFNSNDFESGEGYRKLKKSAIPSIFDTEITK